MLPRPATTRWSSSAALRLVFLPAQARASMAASNALPSGSGPSARNSGSSSSSVARDELHQAEAARIVERDDRAPYDMWNTTWSCAACLASGRDGTRPACVSRAACERRGTSPTCRDASAARRRTTDRPADIWRAGRARRRSCPSSRSAKSFGSGQRRSPRRASTLTKRAPSITGASPRRTVSTSGSSGMD